MVPAPSPVQPEEQMSGAPIRGVGLIVVGGTIIVGTILEDIISGGAGVVDDPPTIAFGAGLIRTGCGCLRSSALRFAQ
jgi:hypothetical protein